MKGKTSHGKATADAATLDFDAVLATWQSATTQIEQTHDALRDKVRRLTNELDERVRPAAGGDCPGDGQPVLLRVAADVRNQLVPITLNLSLLRRRIADDPIGLNILGKIEAGLAMVDANVSDLVYFTSERRPRMCAFSLEKLIDEVLASLAAQLAAQGIETVVDMPKGQSVRADRDMMRHVLTNLAMNALDAMPEGGTLSIIVVPTEQGLEIEVADTGPGLPDAARPHVFEPFFTTKSAATGLGLAVVHRVVEAHGGRVTAMNCPEGGAAFTLCVPRSAMKAAA